VLFKKSLVSKKQRQTSHWTSSICKNSTHK